MTLMKTIKKGLFDQRHQQLNDKDMKNITLFIFLFFSTSTNLLFAFDQDDTDTTSVQMMDEATARAIYQGYADSLEASFNYQTDRIDIKNGLATIQVPEGYKYLGPKESEIVLTDLWGNPPSVEGNRSLGMLFPKDSGPSDTESYAINITYSEEGYINDSDAKDLNYDELLESMIADTKAENDQRIQMGYEGIALDGWASKPYYDAENKKLHWALDLVFGTMEEHTLNYNIRALGRKGYLQLNVIGDMDVLSQVQSDIRHILPSVEFNEGNRYSDFNPDLDKVAAVGIGGLIAGKVLAKAGILAKLGILLTKFWKIIAVVAIGFFAGIRRLFGGKADKQEPDMET